MEPWQMCLVVGCGLVVCGALQRLGMREFHATVLGCSLIGAVVAVALSLDGWQ